MVPFRPALDVLDQTVATHMQDHARLQAAVDEGEVGSEGDCHENPMPGDEGLCQGSASRIQDPRPQARYNSLRKVRIGAQFNAFPCGYLLLKGCP